MSGFIELYCNILLLLNILFVDKIYIKKKYFCFVIVDNVIKIYYCYRCFLRVRMRIVGLFKGVLIRR